jgi:quinol monooxygenase YgiN
VATFDGPRRSVVAAGAGARHLGSDHDEARHLDSDHDEKGFTMIWHIVRFDMSQLEEETRATLEEALEALAELDDVAWLRVARDVDDPTVTGLISAFADYDALERYRVHPDHLPVVARARELGIPAVRLDVATDDDPSALP